MMVCVYERWIHRERQRETLYVGVYPIVYMCWTKNISVTSVQSFHLYVDSEEKSYVTRYARLSPSIHFSILSAHI